LSLPEGVKLKDALSTLVDEMGWAELAEQTGAYTEVWMWMCSWHMYSIEKTMSRGNLLENSALCLRAIFEMPVLDHLLFLSSSTFRPLNCFSSFVTTLLYVRHSLLRAK
jgi:hypothetical protein